MAPQFSFERRVDREILALTYDGATPKEIAVRVDLHTCTVNAHLRGIRQRARVTRAELPIWISQNIECMIAGGLCTPGLHPPGCKCGASYCVAAIAMALRRAEELGRLSRHAVHSFYGEPRFSRTA